MLFGDVQATSLRLQFPAVRKGPGNFKQSLHIQWFNSRKVKTFRGAQTYEYQIVEPLFIAFLIYLI